MINKKIEKLIVMLVCAIGIFMTLGVVGCGGQEGSCAPAYKYTAENNTYSLNVAGCGGTGINSCFYPSLCSVGTKCNGSHHQDCGLMIHYRGSAGCIGCGDIEKGTGCGYERDEAFGWYIRCHGCNQRVGAGEYKGRSCVECASLDYYRR